MKLGDRVVAIEFLASNGKVFTIYNCEGTEQTLQSSMQSVASRFNHIRLYGLGKYPKGEMLSIISYKILA